MFPSPDALPPDAPFWVLQTLELIAREVDEKALSAQFAERASVLQRRQFRCGSWADESFPPWTSSSILPKRTLQPLEECSPLPRELLQEALERLQQAHPSFERRPDQERMAYAVLDALNQGRHLLLEAGTGVGKTLGYLIPAALWATYNDVPIVISTNTRNLQSQLLVRELPTVEAILRGMDGLDSFRSALLKGRGNYLCLQRFGSLLEDAIFSLEPADLRRFAEAIVWSLNTETGDLEEFSAQYGTESDFLLRLSALPEACTCANCRLAKRCFLRKARAKAIQTHILVVNHALVFADLASGAGILPPHHQLILDEAHNIIDVATTHLSSTFSPNEFDRWLRQIAPAKQTSKESSLYKRLLRELPPDSPHPKAVREAALTLRRCATELFKDADRLLSDKSETTRISVDPNGRRTAFNGTAFITTEERLEEDKLLRDLGNFTNACGRLAEPIKQAVQSLAAIRMGQQTIGYADELPGLLQSVLAKLDEYNIGVQFLVKATDPTTIYWVERCAKSASWNAAPLKIASRLSKELFSKLSTALLTSATLRTSVDFSHFARSCGIAFERDKLDTMAVGSPFDYFRQCRVFALDYLPEPTQAEEYTKALADVICATADHHRGRTLVLFTSNQMLQQTAQLCEPRLASTGISLLQQTANSSRDHLTRLFLERDAAVLFGVSSFWEGFDVPGERLSCVIIARLPFPSFGDPILEARCEAIRLEGKSDFAEYTLPEAVIHFRQGFGRLIRSKSDKGDVIITDPRLCTQRYGAVFRKALPTAASRIASSQAFAEALAAPFI
ncbi:MAG: ATP-dependent DNA helicase [Kiritimatiellia bacterium]